MRQIWPRPPRSCVPSALASPPPTHRSPRLLQHAQQSCGGAKGTKPLQPLARRRRTQQLESSQLGSSLLRPWGLAQRLSTNRLQAPPSSRIQTPSAALSPTQSA